MPQPPSSNNNSNKMTVTDSSSNSAAAAAAHEAAPAAAPASTRQAGTPSMESQLGQHSATPFEVQHDYSSSTASAAPSVYAPFNDESVFAFDQGHTTLTGTVDHATSGDSYRPLSDDFFSSPEFTDPSPALTTSLSFGVDSCNTSPLLTDNYEAPEFTGMSLFGSSSTTMDELSLLLGAAAGKQSGATSSAPSPPRRAAQNAFNAGRKSHDDAATASTLQLLQALSSTGFSANDVVRAATQALGSSELATSAATPSTTVSPLVTVIDPVAVTAGSPALFSSNPFSTLSSYPQPSTLPSSSSPSTADERALSPLVASASPLQQQQQPTSDVPASRQSSAGLTTPAPRGTKRRLDTSDLLPIDAPIQPRKYRMPSATSRKDSSDDVTARSARGSVAPGTPVDEMVPTSADPVIAKRLSNTLAARRSRHRKAEELRELHEQIAALTAQVDHWKQRCREAEQQRDEVLSGTL